MSYYNIRGDNAKIFTVKNINVCNIYRYIIRIMHTNQNIILNL